MEPQEKVCCYDNTRHGCEYKEENKKNNCLGIVATILLAAFTTVIGIIIGASLAGTFLEALAAIIVLAVVLGILLILTLILLFCNKGKDKKNKCKCCC